MTDDKDLEKFVKFPSRYGRETTFGEEHRRATNFHVQEDNAHRALAGVDFAQTEKRVVEHMAADLVHAFDAAVERNRAEIASATSTPKSRAITQANVTTASTDLYRLTALMGLISDDDQHDDDND